MEWKIIIILFLVFGFVGSFLMDADHFIDYFNEPRVGIRSITTPGHKPLHVPIFIFVSFILVFVGYKELRVVKNEN